MAKNGTDAGRADEAAILAQMEKPELIIMTPELARAMQEKSLKTGRKHRGISQLTVQRYAEAMSASPSRWIPEASNPFVVEEDGFMQNGWHRTEATVVSGHVWPAIIIRKATKQANRYHDTGRRRTLPDLLREAEVPNAQIMATSSRLLWYWENGYMRGTRSDFTRMRRIVSPDNGQLWDFFHEHEAELQESLRFAMRLRVKLVPRSVAMVAFTMFNRIDHEMAVEFYNQLALRVTEGDQVRLLRRALENLESGGSGTRGDQQHFLALMIKGWNAWMDGGVPENIRWRSGTGSPEKMPEPMGAFAGE